MSERKTPSNDEKLEICYIIQYTVEYKRKREPLNLVSNDPDPKYGRLHTFTNDFVLKQTFTRKPDAEARLAYLRDDVHKNIKRDLKQYRGDCLFRVTKWNIIKEISS